MSQNEASGKIAELLNQSSLTHEPDFLLYELVSDLFFKHHCFRFCYSLREIAQQFQELYKSFFLIELGPLG